MTDEMQLKSPPIESREESIRNLFREFGGSMSTNSFAEKCVDSGIYTDGELRSFGLRHVQAEVRRALKHADANGLPFAGQTAECEEGGAHVWKIRQAWLFEDYELNVRDLMAQATSLRINAYKLMAECEEIHGRRPSVDDDEDRQS